MVRYFLFGCVVVTFVGGSVDPITVTNNYASFIIASYLQILFNCQMYRVRFIFSDTLDT